MDIQHLDLTLESSEETRCRKKFKPVIQEYGKETHFSYKELEALLIIHYKLSKPRPMDRKYFRWIMYTVFGYQNDILIDRIFSAVDRENRLVVTMSSWILMMSVFLRGTLEEKIKFCFAVYDMMGDGYIKKEHMFQALKDTIKGNLQDENPEELVKELIDMFMKSMDHDGDGKISFDDYRTTVWRNPHMLEMLGYCLPARPKVYTFLVTFSNRVSTMHSRMYEKAVAKKSSTKIIKKTN